LSASATDMHLTGIQEPQILLLPVGVVSHARAEECIDFAVSYGMDLDESQKITLRAGMGTRADGRWAAPQVGDAESRQNGKGDTIQARAAFGGIVIGQSVIHTAHEAKTSTAAHLRMVALLDAWDELRRLVKIIRYGSGERAIEFLNGSMIRYMTRTGGGGRGLDDVGLLIYDEAQHLQPEHMAASSPILAVNPNPQLWVAGSAGLSTSRPWWAMRKQAIRGVRGATAFVEHTAEVIYYDEQDKLVSEKPDPRSALDRAKANPAYNVRISDEFLESQLTLLGDELFMREHLGVWDVLADDVDGKLVKLPAAAWAATVGPDPASESPTVLTFDVSRDGEWSTVAIAAGTMSSPYVEVIAHKQGVGWLPSFLVDKVRSIGPVVVGVNGAGPAGAQVGPVLAAFADAGIESTLLKQLSTTEYKQACGGFYTDVTEGRLRRPDQGFDGKRSPLDIAAADATERPLGDAWAWDFRNATVPISPLVAVTVARSLLPAKDTTTPVRPLFKFS
jgi:hypothetical protein